MSLSVPLLFVHLYVCTAVLQPTLSSALFSLEMITITGSVGSCPSMEEREQAFQNITSDVQDLLRNFVSTPNCGPGVWHQIASLNMSDPSQNCPTAWRNDVTNRIRSCRRPQSSGGSCVGTSFNSGRTYTKVCGRAIGYQVASTDGFDFGARGHGIDSYYVYGVSITHGMPRNHIWTLASGITEQAGEHGLETGHNCPCSEPHPTQPPSFVGDNYYCESGNSAITGPTWIRDHLYSEDSTIIFIAYDA